MWRAEGGGERSHEGARRHVVGRGNGTRWDGRPPSHGGKCANQDIDLLAQILPLLPLRNRGNQVFCSGIRTSSDISGTSCDKLHLAGTEMAFSMASKTRGAQQCMRTTNRAPLMAGRPAAMGRKAAQSVVVRARLEWPDPKLTELCKAEFPDKGVGCRYPIDPFLRSLLSCASFVTCQTSPGCHHRGGSVPVL